MSCKLWGKVTSVSVNINFGARMSLFYEKNWIFGRNVDFSLSVHYYWKWLSYCKICLVLEKCDFLSEGFIYINKVSNSDKNFNFLGFVILYVLIFIKVFHLSENCYFDSKYHFVHWYFGQVPFS